MNIIDNKWAIITVVAQLSLLEFHIHNYHIDRRRSGQFIEITVCPQLGVHRVRGHW